MLSDGSRATGNGNGIFSISVSPTSNTTYTISSLSDANCISIAADLTGSTLITVNSRPTASVTSANTAICNGNSTTITGNVTASGAWTLTLNNGGGTVTGTGSGTWSKSVTPSATTTYSISSLTDASCTSIAADLTGSTQVTVNARPTATITSTNTSICNGSSANITGTVTALGGWTVTLNNGAMANGNGNGTFSISVSPSSNTTYTISSLSDANCTSTAADLSGSTQVSIYTRPTASITSSNTTICNGNNYPITGSVVASGAWTLTLSDGTTTTGNGNSTFSVSVTPSSTTNYTISSLTDSRCSSIPADLTGSTRVTVRPIFTPGEINAAGETICYGGDPGEIGSITPASGGDNVISYVWHSSTKEDFSTITLISSNTSTYNPPANLTTTTYYRRLAYDGTCNPAFTISNGVWKVTVEPLPTATSGGSQTICSGSTATVSGATASNGTILWTTSNGSGTIDNATTLTQPIMRLMPMQTKQLY